MQMVRVSGLLKLVVDGTVLWLVVIKRFLTPIKLMLEELSSERSSCTDKLVQGQDVELLVSVKE